MSNISIKPGTYIENNNDGYWYATADQAKAYKNFPRHKYSGQGSSYWIGSSLAKEKVQGKHDWTFEMLYDGSTFWLKTSDGKFRQIMEITKPKKIPF